MIRCLEGAQYQSCESRTKKKRFTEDSYHAPVYTFRPSTTLSYSTYSYISGYEIKIEKKRSRLYFYTKVLSFFTIYNKATFIIL